MKLYMVLGSITPSILQASILNGLLPFNPHLIKLEIKNTVQYSNFSNFVNLEDTCEWKDTMSSN